MSGRRVAGAVILALPIAFLLFASVMAHGWVETGLRLLMLVVILACVFGGLELLERDR